MLKALVTPSRVIVALLLIGTAAAMAFSGRPWRGYSAPLVAEIATLPDTERLAPLRRYAEIGSGIFYYIDGPRPELGATRQPLKLGFAYQEVGVLGMPYRVKEEFGLVVYFETPYGTQVAAIAPGQLALLSEMLGRPVAANGGFRWWTRIWGWLFPLGIALLILAWRREARIREEEELRA